MRSFICIFTFAVIGSLVLYDTQAKSMTENAAVQEYLEKLLKSGYNKNILPVSSEGHGRPVQVRCTLHLLNVYKVDETRMDYRAQFYFRRVWNDSRLAYTEQDISTVVLNDSKFIWTPVLFFRQEKEGLLHNLIEPNIFIRITPEGEVLYSLRLSVTFSCSMDFRKYPHDTQTCVFTVERNGLMRDQIQVSWDDRQLYQAVSSSDDIDLMTFKFKGIKENIKHHSEKYGEYTHLEVELTFQRKIGFFVTKMYVPFTFLVAISWLTLWIPVKFVIPRLSLLLVVMYIMVNLGFDINIYIPPASYTKGSDVWIAVCESLVFTAFLEFIAVYMIFRNNESFQKRMCKKDLEPRIVMGSNDMKNGERGESANSAMNRLSNLLKRDMLISSRIDKIARALFPILFLVFNFVYWIVYATGH